MNWTGIGTYIKNDKDTLFSAVISLHMERLTVFILLFAMIFDRSFFSIMFTSFFM